MLGAELEVTVLLAIKRISVCRVENHSLDYTEGHIAYIFHGDDAVVVFTALDDGDMRTSSSTSSLILTLFEQFRAIHL